MLCEINEASGSFFSTWAWLSLLETFFLFLTSAPVFYYYYWNTNVTYQKWIYKSNPKFPSPEKVKIVKYKILLTKMLKVRDEIVQMMKGMLCATVCPALALELSRIGVGQAFCGWGDRSVLYHVGTLLLSWIVTDFFEFSYHRLGHLDLRY